MKLYSMKQTPHIFPFSWTIYSSREFVLKHNQEKKNPVKGLVAEIFCKLGKTYQLVI